ncbi:MAG: hypothetical protein KDA32_13415 [Phycisphaerales bacterium]|nr:hypothetical protein [Phycisphaerales bacterium]
MNPGPSVVVRKGGFFSALVTGFFGFLITVVLAVTILGVAAMWVFDSRVTQLFGFAETAVRGLAGWRETFPPALVDALDDRPANDYWSNVDVGFEFVQDERRPRMAVTIQNHGAETISLLTLQVLLRDEAGVPVHDFMLPVATPLPLDDDLPGPILPGSTRTLVVPVYRAAALRAEAEPSMLRVQKRQAPAVAESSALPPATEPPLLPATELTTVASRD